jgi:hypothetical protein
MGHIVTSRIQRVKLRINKYLLLPELDLGTFKIPGFCQYLDAHLCSSLVKKYSRPHLNRTQISNQTNNGGGIYPITVNSTVRLRLCVDNNLFIQQKFPVSDLDPDYGLSWWRSFVAFSVPPANAGIVLWMRPRPLPTKSFPIHRHSLTTLSSVV